MNKPPVQPVAKCSYCGGPIHVYMTRICACGQCRLRYLRCRNCHKKPPQYRERIEPDASESDSL